MSAEETELLSGSAADSSGAGIAKSGGEPQEIDLVDEILGGLASASAEEVAAQPKTPDSSQALETAAAVEGDANEKFSGTKTAWVTDIAVEPPIEAQAPADGATGRHLHVPHPLSRTRRVKAAEGETARPKTRSRRLLRFVFGFAVATVGVVLLLVAAAAGARSMYSDRVVPGVHVGSVDVSGLTRDQVIARLQSAYSYVGEGEITVTTATGTAKITYQQTGRVPDVGTMAYEAIRIGHTGDPLADTVAMLRTAYSGETVPLSVTLDPKAVAIEVRHLVSTNQAPRDAQATVSNNSFSLQPSVDGRGIDEVAISSAIVDHLSVADQAANFQAGGAFIVIKPNVSDKDAQAAISEAQKMLVDLNLTYADPAAASASPSAAASQSPSPGKTFKITSDTVLSWISFGFDSQGRYVASVDPAKIQSTVAGMSIKVGSAPVDPKVTFDAAGKPSGVEGGQDGVGIDITATSQAIATYLDSLASGGSQGPIAIVTGSVPSQITPDSLTGMVIIGSWTTTFYPDISNGNGANIRTPAKIFNGQVVLPGQQFSFMSRVGPIDPAHGFTLGGVIEHGKSDHTGAMGGGICSASTTMFNAAVWAGLEIDERHNHAYYIDRYPVGLDATVFSNGYQTYDMKWRNDTANPIVIRGTSTRGSRSTVTFQLWSLPLDRKVSFTPPFKANVSKATDSTVYTTKIPPGTKNRAEYPTDGYDTSRTRTVTDSTGKVIHTDTWKSHYITVDGILQIGVAPGSLPTPKPVGGSTPTPPPAVTPTVAPRRRTSGDETPE
jgi:vancomycin resistance protein YoaR